MSPTAITFLISLGATILGISIVLLIERFRLPKIEIVVSEDANDDVTYHSGHPRSNQRWKFFRVWVKNKPMPKWLRWLVRETAENCRAIISIDGMNNQIRIVYKARWASTPEIPSILHEAGVKITHPDPVSMTAGEKEPLDIIAKYEKDSEAYGWNNESYFHNWRNPNYKLDPGQYRVKITVDSQNGISAAKEITLVVGPTIDQTYFSV